MKRKGPTKTTLRKRLDAAWSRKVRELGWCERCGSAGYLHAHHIFGRSNYRLRFDVRNGVCLCPTCHRWAHNNPVLFADWVRANRKDDVEYLESIHSEASHYALDDYRAMLAEFEEAA